MQTNKTDYFYFYPDLWLSDPALIICSYQTQGVWINMLCYMAKVTGFHCGTLTVNGKALDKDKIRQLMRIDSEVFESAWDELIKNGILKKSPSGIYYSKRLVLENKKRQKALESIEKRKKITTEEKERRAKERIEKHRNLREAVVEYLNEKTGRKSKIDSHDAIDHINGRAEEGYELEHFKAVIDVKTKQWLNQESQRKFLRCSTLFAPKHFNNYLNENEDWLAEQGNHDLENAVIKYFCQITGKKYKVDSAISALIVQLSKLGYTTKDFVHVIDVKTSEWKGTEHDNWLTPTTLFEKTKFQNYLNQKKQPRKNVIITNKGKGYGDIDN